VHIALLPGTDGALALGLMHELIVNDWLDHDYIEQHTEGWPVLRERALAWPPERVAAVCGIEAALVRTLARDYGTTKPAAIRLNYGMQRAHGGGNAVRLAAILPCLVGAWRHRAGGLLLSASGWFRHARNDAALERRDLLGERRPRTINMSTIGDDLLREGGETLPDGSRFGSKIEALVVYNSNPVAVAPHSQRVVEGFAREDLFTVVLEHFMTDTADLADYVLPATTQLEHLDVHTAYGHTYALVNEAAIAPRGEAKPNTQIFRELAARLGFSDPCFADSDEDLARQAFRPAAQGGLDFADLREHGWVKLDIGEAPLAAGGFATPSGKCRIDAPGYGVPDYVPNYESAASTPELAARYPLAMISPPERNFLNSSFVNIKSLRGGEGEPVVEIAGADAARRGIASGQRVRIFNERGSIECKAVVGERARPGVVNGMGIWWKKLAAGGRNVNELTHQRLTDIGRAPSFYDCLVEVEPASRLPA
jgi:anaerobic selenocysteine-containing dehydrogenase